MVTLKLSATMGEKGQVVIPKSVRDLLGLSPRSEVQFSVESDHVILEKRSSKKAYEEFVSASKEKLRFPKNVDWDNEYASQFR